MADPFKFLTSLAQALSTMALYTTKHPARERAIDRSFSALRDLQAEDPKPQFSFLGEETVYGQISLRDLREWEWAARLGDAGVQRLEFEPNVTREEYEEFLDQVLARLTLAAIDTAEMRTTRPGAIKFGAIGVRGEAKKLTEVVDAKVPVATISFSLEEEAAAVQWMHGEVGELAPARAVVAPARLPRQGSIGRRHRAPAGAPAHGPDRRPGPRVRAAQVERVDALLTGRPAALAATASSPAAPPAR